MKQQLFVCLIGISLLSAVSCKKTIPKANGFVIKESTQVIEIVHNSSRSSEVKDSLITETVDELSSIFTLKNIKSSNLSAVDPNSKKIYLLNETDLLSIQRKIRTEDWFHSLEQMIQEFQGVKNNGESAIIFAQEDNLFIVSKDGHDKYLYNAVKWLIRKMGVNHYYPGSIWKYTPSLESFSLNERKILVPLFFDRTIRYSYGIWPDLREEYTEWQNSNGGYFFDKIYLGHAYDTIVQKNRDDFENNPSWRPQDASGNTTSGNKFCVLEPGLQAKVKDYLNWYLDRYPERKSLSLDPSDGGGWEKCNTAEDQMSVSDRVLTLANMAAEYTTALPGREDFKISLYAYNQHSPPPTIAAHPNISVFVATSFLTGNLSFNQTVQGWKESGASVGVRDYLSIVPWKKNLPSTLVDGSFNRALENIRSLESIGMQYYNAEAGYAFGPYGLGLFASLRSLYDGSNSFSSYDPVNRFIEEMFPQSKLIMKSFFESLQGQEGQLLGPHLLAILYNYLSTALEQVENGSDEQKRINAYTLYTRYLELYLAYDVELSPSIRQNNFRDLIMHAYKMRTTHMVHSLALYRDLEKRDGLVSIPSPEDNNGVDVRFSSPEESNPWKSSQEFTREELDSYIENGITQYRPAPFNTKTFSDDLVAVKMPRPAWADDPQLSTRGNTGYLRSKAELYTFRPAQGSGAISLKIRTGIIPRGEAKNNISPIQVRVYAKESTLMELVDQAEVKSNWVYSHTSNGKDIWEAEYKDVCLCSPYKGPHKIGLIDSSRAGFNLLTPEGEPYVIESTPSSIKSMNSRWFLNQYIPKGTPLIGMYSSRSGSSSGMRLYDGDGRLVCPQSANDVEFNYCHLGKTPPGFYYYEVPPEQSGKVWRVTYGSGQKLFMTTPVQLGQQWNEILLPREVAISDGLEILQNPMENPHPACVQTCHNKASGKGR